MKIPQFALNGSYLTSTTGSSSHGNTSSTHGNGSSYLDSSSDRNNNSPLLSPTPTSDDHKFMVDMAVAKDKTPFLLANKANDNLQRALNKFMVYHERERKVIFTNTISHLLSIIILQCNLMCYMFSILIRLMVTSTSFPVITVSNSGYSNIIINQFTHSLRRLVIISLI